MTANQFDAALKRLDLTPQTAAPLLGVGWRTCYRYETGDTAVPESIAKLLKLLEAHKSGVSDAVKALDALAAGKL